MIYTLCHKDIHVLNFKVEDDEITEILDIINKRHLPIGVFKEHDTEVSQKKQFRNWWRGRAIPATRQNLRDALEVLGNITTEQLVTKSYGLSLTDQYWAKPCDKNLKWKDVNFFNNAFSEDVGKALFGILNVHDIPSISLISPDNTSDGWLKKKWVIKDFERILIKGGSGTEQREPFNEVLASEICKRLNIPHVEYSITEQKKDYYSLCKNFITADTELIPALRIYSLKEYKGGLWDKYTHFKDCCNLAGIDIKNIEKQLCSMFVVDYIMANVDRHFGNFGFIRNADTLEWLGLAPVYDTGSSMFYKSSKVVLKEPNTNDSAVIKARPFGYTQKDQLKLLPCSKLCKDLPFENLSDITQWYNSLLKINRNIDDDCREIFCKILGDRVKETTDLIRNPELFHKPRKTDYNWER